MSLHLITGYAGKEHITAADQGAYNAGTFGAGRYVLNTGNKFAYEVVTNNLIKVRDGELIDQGRHLRIAIDDYEECSIDNGIQSLKRNDLIAIRYEKNTDTGIESPSMVVIKGVSGETAADPSYIDGDIINGDTVDEVPLYRVKLNGLNIEAVEPMFDVMISMAELKASVEQKFDSVNKDLSDLNSGLEGKANTNHTHDDRYYTEAEIKSLLAVSIGIPTVWNTTTIRANGAMRITKAGNLSILTADITTLAKIAKSGAILTIPTGYTGAYTNVPCDAYDSSGNHTRVGIYTASSDGYSHVYVNEEVPAGCDIHIVVAY